jgi:hypothetical protein
MADAYKALIVELNGVELQDASEQDIRASTILFSENSFDANSIKDAIVEARNTYSWRIVDRDITIPFNQQMVVYQDICIEDGIELTILGELAVLE